MKARVLSFLVAMVMTFALAPQASTKTYERAEHHIAPCASYKEREAALFVYGFYVAYMSGIMYSPSDEMADYLSQRYAPFVSQQNAKCDCDVLIDAQDCSEEHLQSLFVRPLGNNWFEVTYKGLDNPYADYPMMLLRKIHVHLKPYRKIYYRIDKVRNLPATIIEEAA